VVLRDQDLHRFAHPDIMAGRPVRGCRNERCWPMT
jgi:hypothetical protein